MMRTLECYRHVNNTDVAIWPLKIYKLPEKGIIKVKCRWFNIVDPTNVFDLGVIDNVEIKIEDLGNWRIYENQ